MNHPIRILVAAPDGSDAKGTVDALREAGLEVVWRRVESRAALRAALDEQGADLVLLDPSVAGISGPDGPGRPDRPGGPDPIDGTERDEEHGHTEQRLRLLERAVETSPVMVTLTDREGRIEYVNPAFTRATGYTEEEMLGETPRKLNSGMQPPELYEELWATIRSGREWRGELTNRREDGTLYDVDLTIAPVTGADGEVTHFAGLSLDITARKKLENQLRQAQKMEAVGQLTGGIAHDFNNILTAISTNAEIVQSLLPAGSELDDDLREILRAAERGATMIGRLLQFSRQGMLSMEEVAVGRVASGLCPMLQRLLPETIDLEIRDDSRASDRARADVTTVEQMLVNLCTNARDAMPEGGTLRIECERTTLDGGYVATHPWVEPGDYVSLAVSDSGTGMDRATRDKAFEPFFTTKPTGKGTGLGLAMVYGLMKQHLGMVHIYSEPGTGTTVKLYFPVAEDAGDAGTHDDRSRARAEPEAAEPDALGCETILVVEDEPSIQRATRRALESTGYTVLLAADGEEALEIFRKRRDEVALVISDLVMPNLGGRQLTDVLRGEGETVPILLTSGYSPGSASGSFELPEGVAFIQKPWSLSELLECVRAMLDGART